MRLLDTEKLRRFVEAAKVAEEHLFEIHICTNANLDASGQARCIAAEELKAAREALES